MVVESRAARSLAMVMNGWMVRASETCVGIYDLIQKTE